MKIIYKTILQQKQLFIQNIFHIRSYDNKNMTLKKKINMKQYIMDVFQLKLSILKRIGAEGPTLKTSQ